jgi:hypothetical protein
MPGSNPCNNTVYAYSYKQIQRLPRCFDISVDWRRLMTSSVSAFISRAQLSAAQRESCRATSFTIRSSRLLRVQAGLRNPELARLLKMHNASTAALVAAYNPSGRVAAAKHNKTCDAALAAAIKTLKLTALPAQRHALGNGDASDPAYFVLNISGAQAEELLIQFDQHALLWCNQSGEPPELMLHPLVRQREPKALW